MLESKWKRGICMKRFLLSLTAALGICGIAIPAHAADTFVPKEITIAKPFSDVVYFDVKEREAGVSKYTFSKMLKLATDGITSMSTRPIQLITMLGFAVCLFSVGMIIYCLVDWAMGKNIPGYTTSLVISLLMGGLTLFSLGIVGEYVGKIYLEAKARPRYIVQSFIWKKGKELENNENLEKTHNSEKTDDL